MNGYEFKTTFWNDFCIADIFGASAVKDTYRRAMEEWKDNYIYLTELVLVLNWKCWDMHDKGHIEESILYEDLYYKAKEYAENNLTGDEIIYYFNVTD